MQRDLTIDTLKGFLIILVILGHLIGSLNVYGGDKIWNFIYTFHMPLFVLISGYFSNHDKLSIQPLKPLLMFQLINVIILAILGYSFSFTFFLIPYWTLWYLLSLVFWRIILRYIPKGLLKRSYLFLGLSMGIALLFGVNFPYGRILSIQRTINFLPFFLMGYYFRMNMIKQKLWSNNISIALLIAICVFIIFVWYPSNANVLLRGADSYSFCDLPAKVLILICTLVCIYALWNLKKENHYLAEIGKYSLFYYLYHGLIIQFFIVPIVKRLNLPAHLLYCTLYLLFILCILHLMNKLKFFRWFTNPTFN